MHQKSESKSRSRNRVSARAKLEVSNVFYAYFILKQKNVKYGVFYYFSAVSFNYEILTQYVAWFVLLDSFISVHVAE